MTNKIYHYAIDCSSEELYNIKLLFEKKFKFKFNKIGSIYKWHTVLDSEEIYKHILSGISYKPVGSFRLHVDLTQKHDDHFKAFSINLFDLIISNCQNKTIFSEEENKYYKINNKQFIEIAQPQMNQMKKDKSLFEKLKNRINPKEFNRFKEFGNKTNLPEYEKEYIKNH